MKFVKIILLLLTFAASNVYSLFVPVFTSQTETDVVPKLGSGLFAIGYTWWVSDAIADPFPPPPPSPAVSVKGSGLVSISSPVRVSLSREELTLSGELGLGRSIGIRADLPYYEMDDLGLGQRGFGDVSLSGKWNFADSQDSSRAGISMGCTFASGNPSFSPGYIVPWGKVVYGIHIGSHRLIGNIGYRYMYEDKYGNDDADHIPFSLAVQLNGQDVMVVPVEFIGDYQFHSLGEPSNVSIFVNITANVFVLPNHLCVGPGLLIPCIAPYGSDIVPHLNSAFYF